MPHPDTLPTPEAVRYAGVNISTLRRHGLKPVGYRGTGRAGRPFALWSVADLDRFRVMYQRKEGRRHA